MLTDQQEIRMKRRALLAVAIVALTGCVSVSGSHHDGHDGSGAVQNCKQTSEEEIAGLFNRWNASLQTGDPAKVAANYAEDAILLPTVSNKTRLTTAEREDYFHHFLEDQPTGKIDMRRIYVGCNTAVDAGLYTFTFARTGAVVAARFTYTYRWNGSAWLITSHHSSAMPEK
jgi:uncharacterized protein (TIGR02246 family)